MRGKCLVKLRPTTASNFWLFLQIEAHCMPQRLLNARAKRTLFMNTANLKS